MDQDKTRHLGVCTHEGPAFGATGMLLVLASTAPPGAGRRHIWGEARLGTQLGTGAELRAPLVTKVAVDTWRQNLSELEQTSANSKWVFPPKMP